MKVQELLGLNITDMKVAVSHTFNQGYELEQIKQCPDEFQDLLNQDVKFISKSKNYDLVIHI